jgi:hypothetical protein
MAGHHGSWHACQLASLTWARRSAPSRLSRMPRCHSASPGILISNYQHAVTVSCLPCTRTKNPHLPAQAPAETLAQSRPIPMCYFTKASCTPSRAARGLCVTRSTAPARASRAGGTLRSITLWLRRENKVCPCSLCASVFFSLASVRLCVLVSCTCRACVPVRQCVSVAAASGTVLTD